MCISIPNIHIYSIYIVAHIQKKDMRMIDYTLIKAPSNSLGYL